MASRKVIVTGASSFVGCHLARAFAAHGDRVIATHSQPSPSAYDGIRADRLHALEARCTLAALDITDGDAVGALIDREAPDIWVHHAGFATDYASPDYDPLEGQRVNVAPLEALYQHLENTPCGVILTGSSGEYASSEDANREDDPCHPETPYGISKLSECDAARRLAADHGVPTRVARLYIPFGSLDNPKKLLSQVVGALGRGEPVDLSPCEQARDFIGIADVCAGYLALADDLARTGFDIFNLSSGTATPLSALLETVAAALHADPALLRFGAIPMRPGEPPVSFGDNAKAKAILGWTPRTLDLALRDDLLSSPDTGF